MANKFLFEVDASKILAKLHLAGLMPVSVNMTDHEFIGNSGIVNYTDGATPDKPKDVMFDLSNPVKEYQIGFFTTLHYSSRPLDKTKVQEMIDKEKAKLSHDKSPSSMLSETDSGSSDSSSEQSSPELDSLRQQLENADKFNDQSKKEYDDALTELKTNAVKNLVKYMTVFAGSDQGKKVTEANVVAIQVPDTADSPANSKIFDNFEIVKITDGQKAEHDKKNEAAWMQVLQKSGYNFEKASKTNKDKLTDRICFATAFTLQIDR